MAKLIKSPSRGTNEKSQLVPNCGIHNLPHSEERVRGTRIRYNITPLPYGDLAIKRSEVVPRGRMVGVGAYCRRSLSSLADSLPELSLV